jgi:hypothetical protein
VVTDRAKIAELRAAGKFAGRDLSLGEIAAEMGLAKTSELLLGHIAASLVLPLIGTVGPSSLSLRAHSRWQSPI